LTQGPFDSATQNSNVQKGCLFLLERHANGLFYKRPFPLTAQWKAPTKKSPRGSVTFPTPDPAEDVTHIWLSRYLSFDQSFPSAVKKAIVVIHGWNPSSAADPYTPAYWRDLRQNLEKQVQGKGWTVYFYNMARDMDTGAVWSKGLSSESLLYAFVNANEAALIAVQHGYYLGEQMLQSSPGLEKVHIIAHSAGTWAARAAARYIAQNSAHSPRIQITLLDPFVPTRVEAEEGDSPLNSGLIEDVFDDIPGLEIVENYWSQDLALGTNGAFAWPNTETRTSVNLQLDRLVPAAERQFPSHEAPIRYYADTVKAPTAELAMELGWQLSLAYAEPGVPTKISASDKLANQIEVTWQKAAGATAYAVWRGADGRVDRATCIEPDFSDSSSAQTCIYTDTRVVPGQQYYYWVSASNGTEQSARGDPDAGVCSLAVTAFTINNGDKVCSLRAVTLDHATSSSASHFMASENSKFLGAAWQTYATAPDFTLSPGNGMKTVYFKAKCGLLESKAVPASISLVEPPVVTSFSLNSGAVATASASVSLNNVCTDAPTHYQASESSDFAGAAWVKYSKTPKFTLSFGTGTKTVYLRVKNAGGTSATSSDTILLLQEAAVTSFAICDGEAITSSPTVTLNNLCLGSPTHYMASESADFRNASWQSYATARATPWRAQVTA
jgi:hypothetical protein